MKTSGETLLKTTKTNTENFKNIHSDSLVDYYNKHKLNPVPLPLDTDAEWEEHIAKRRNLYENHLKIPINIFNNKDVLEFGCNSGENALYLAYLDANLTLVEPNENVHDRLIKLFNRRRLQKQIFQLTSQTIEQYKSNIQYDFVIAEGFLNTLKKRDKALIKICDLIQPGGFGIVTEDDRYGCFVECIKQITLKRICELMEINFHSQESFKIAKILFEREYLKLKTPRPIVTWWKDAIVSPYNTGKFLWTFMDIIDIITNNNCEFCASSPNWTSIDKYQWYKNTKTVDDRVFSLRKDFNNSILYFLTGINNEQNELNEYDNKLIKKISIFIDKAAEYTTSDNMSYTLLLPDDLTKLLRSQNNILFNSLSDDLENLFSNLSNNDPNNIIDTYLNTDILKSLWGNTMFFIAFKKNT